MYNFWRWYPWGKIIFLAPTKPLVTQQIFACHNTMGIPSAETIELTGKKIIYEVQNIIIFKYLYLLYCKNTTLQEQLISRNEKQLGQKKE